MIGLTRSSARGIAGMKRRVAQRLVVRQVDDLPQIAERHDAVDFVAIDLREVERAAARRSRMYSGIPRSISSRTGSPKRRRCSSDSIARKQIVGFVFLQIEVGVARHAEEIRLANVHAGEERVEMMRDQILEQHEVPLAVGRAFERNEARQRRRNLHARKVQLDAVGASALRARPRARARDSKCTGTDGRSRPQAASAPERAGRRTCARARLRLVVELRDAQRP